MRETATGGVELELCMRTAAPSVARGRQAAVRERAEGLAESDHVSAFEVTYWSTRVCVRGETAGPTDRCPRVVEEILAVESEPDASVRPYFRTRPARFDASGEAADRSDERVLFLPVLCLLVRREGDLRGIYPATVEGTRYTVEDGLDRLDAVENVENLA